MTSHYCAIIHIIVITAIIDCVCSESLMRMENATY